MCNLYSIRRLRDEVIGHISISTSKVDSNRDLGRLPSRAGLVPEPTCTRAVGTSQGRRCIITSTESGQPFKMLEADAGGRGLHSFSPML